MLYIDTERKFSAGRLVEVAAARASGAGPHSNPDSIDPAALAARVLIATPASAADLLAMLQASLQLIPIDTSLAGRIVYFVVHIRLYYVSESIPGLSVHLGSSQPYCRQVLSRFALHRRQKVETC